MKMNRIIIGVGLLFWSLVAVALATEAKAEAQPYGGCVEAHRYPHSAGANDCRAAGWIIKRKLVVNPHVVVVYSTMPHCKGERIRSCTWNVIFSRDRSVCDGDCYRAPYWADARGNVHFVYGTKVRKELHDPLYVDCDYAYCGIVGPDEEDRAPLSNEPLSN